MSSSSSGAGVGKDGSLGVLGLAAAVISDNFDEGVDEAGGVGDRIILLDWSGLRLSIPAN